MILKLLTFSFLFFELISFGQWEQRASITFIKDHGIGFSLGGFGYVLSGGEDNNAFGATKDFYKYDPNTDTWEQLPDYPGPPRGVGIGDTWNGKLYFGFGENQFGLMSDLWSWDPVTNTFAQLPSCPCEGRTHPAFLAVDGKVYVGTGGGAAGDLDDWWEYDIATQQWTQKASISEARHHPYQFAIDGEAYVGSGHQTTWYKYDAVNDAWISIAGLSTRVAGAQFSYNGKGYALSGSDDNHNSFLTGEFWEYDPIADTWTALPAHPGASRWAPAQFVIDNYVYLVAGYYNNNDNYSGETTTWRYDLGPSTVGLEEKKPSFNGSVYPNPANNELNIKLSEEVSDNTVINIYNLSGQLIMSSSFVTSLNISTLNNGMYVIDIVDEGVSVLKQKISKV